ncbi:MAG: hypothetical protein ACF8PN_04435 [Phycisphaerales bacterium]
MSAKWRRNRKWDQEHLTGPFTPVRWLLLAFSSITLAVILLTTVALYGAFASVPIGLWALIPTMAFYALTFVLVVGAVVTIPAWLLKRPTGKIAGPGARFVVRFVGVLALLVAGGWLWTATVWPMVRYVPGPEPTGVRFFADFVDANSALLLRQLPAFEMTELEFYGWWPFRLVLVLFVMNMIVATIRRIEFKFVNIGVLTVHTGIVLMALGSIFYKSNKVEGSMLLLQDAALPKDAFYDNIMTAVYLSPAGDSRELTIRLPRLPRYNDAPPGSEHAPEVPLHQYEEFQEFFGPDLEAEVCGVYPYATRFQDGWAPGGDRVNPSIAISLETEKPLEGETTHLSERLVGLIPAESTNFQGRILAIQHLPVPSRQRVEDLKSEFPSPGRHLLIIRLPRSGVVEKRVVEVGDRFEVGEPAWTVEVTEHEFHDEGLQLITQGYRGAASSRLKLELTSPGGETVTRSVLSRFPELTQDFRMIPGQAQPQRTPPNPDIDITYLDATMTNFFVLQPDPTKAEFEVIRREPGGGLRVDSIAEGGRVGAGEIFGEPLFLHVRDAWPQTEQNIVVRSVPEDDRVKDRRGTYIDAFLCIEFRAPRPGGELWVHRAWLPFNQFVDADANPQSVIVTPPNRGAMRVSFGRLRRALPDIALELEDFEMIPYPGSDTPRDYVSSLRVYEGDSVDPIRHDTRLNRPYIYRVPFEPDENLSFVTNTARRVFRFFVPDQYKFSQAGWDPERQAYTVLGVGNNSGIYIIAVGGVLIGAGIPWAFYIKPAILRYRKRRIQRELEAGEYTVPSDSPGGASANASRAPELVEASS